MTNEPRGARIRKSTRSLSRNILLLPEQPKHAVLREMKAVGMSSTYCPTRFTN